SKTPLALSHGNPSSSTFPFSTVCSSCDPDPPPCLPSVPIPLPFTLQQKGFLYAHLPHLWTPHIVSEARGLRIGGDMSCGVGELSQFLLFLLLLLGPALGGASFDNLQQLGRAEPKESWVMRPVAAPKMSSLLLNETRRRLGSFQICALCTCCGGPRGLCLPSPCCYSINCNIPNRPFGFCSFTPNSCNCFGCHL
ncbi:hypothetical protein Taro_004833, partial [Colocasia esculenta]|nr:hypothetical protein [Colocasia esculenta]